MFPLGDLKDGLAVLNKTELVHEIMVLKHG